MKSICSFVFVVCICLLTVSLYPRAARAETCEKWVAKVVSAQGTVEAQRAGETGWQPVELNGTYCPGDTIRVDKRSRADIALVNHPVLRLDQNTTITLGGLKDERTSLIDMLSGAAHFFSRVARNLEVRTAFVNAGVEGTEFFIRVEEDKTSISIFEGKVLASNEAGSLAVTSGQSAEAEAGQAPALRVVVSPRDAVQWALYYPPLIYYRPADFQGFPETDWQSMAQESIDAYWMGDLTGAFSGIEEVPEDIPDPHFFTYRASLLLTVGRVDDAGGDIERALSLDPENSDAFALQSIIAVAQNEKEEALNLAQGAVETDPDSATARIALSYAEQANFNLEGALSSLKEAVRLGPENALAWARLAEMWMSFGELDEALEAAKKAVDLNPDLSRTQTVLGFAYLTQVNTKEARGAFEKAIELDSAAPLPRLGLGLSNIREGNIDEGRREIEIAVSLDPDNSIIRSYLGKSYFEEKRDKLSMDQYDMAKTLDPLDPTPFFYDAIRKQTENRPVEALHDLQSAIELNDNRAVYRSRLLLDSDLAARSASLARIYSDLGFQQLALVEGWKSVNIDPGNYSAHRFLADTYSALPRHEIARVSELLQSQLLQPINITPIQASLSESNLFLISAGGPAELSFNEFNPLFNRDRIALQASGIVGENSTVGEDVVVSGIYKKASFSFGATHFETDGWRKNADQDDDIVNAFLQLELSPKTSIQTEYRYRDTERGDLSLRFLPGDFFPDLRQEDETKMVRAGFHHAFSPGSDLIGNFMYQEADRSLGVTIPDPLQPLHAVLNLGKDEDALGGELQYLFSSKYIKFTSGVGHFEIDSEDITDAQIFFNLPDPPVLIDSFTLVEEPDINHTNLYLYSYINYPENVTFTVGVSADFFDEDREDATLERDEDQFNPKFGITWNPIPSTTLRGAVFRTLKRLLITDQTLEPTQVAGFNQFFDDANATETWRYGGAIDQKFSKNIYGGAEYSERELEVPLQAILAGGAIDLLEVDWDERQARAYLYWTPHEWLALSAEYLYEEFEREGGPGLSAFGIKDLETQRVPLGFNFYHPSGFIARLKATYYDQQGSFERQIEEGIFIDGEDDFWVADASISYRLPKRFGFITVGAKNLFNESFQYFDTDIDNPVIQPDSLFFARLTLSI
jgi:tetratricopeptide (TPR) repeat protein